MIIMMSRDGTAAVRNISRKTLYRCYALAIKNAYFAQVDTFQQLEGTEI